MRVLVVCGLDFEARIAAGAGCETLHGMRGTALAEALASRLRAGVDGVDGVLSFGVAGGLAPGLEAGDVVVADTVLDGERRLPTDAGWTQALRQALAGCKTGLLAGVDAPVTTVAAKAALHHTHGAAIVDMESHLAARVAHAHGIPFAACRVVLDSAARAVPAAAVAGMADDGRSDVLAVLAALAKSPRELGPLLRLARDAATARVALRNARRALGEGFSLPAALLGETHA